MSSPQIDGPTCTVVILTFNEHLHIARCIDSLRPLAARIVVVDSFSTDDTVAIAKAQGAEIYQNRFVNYAAQSEWALENTGIVTPWIMRMDADEVIGADLAHRLRDLMAELPESVTALSLDRRHYFMGRWIRHGGRFPLRLVRVFRRGRGHVEHRWMDEHVVVDGGEVRHVAGEFSDVNLNDLSFFTRKHDGYATREAIDALIGKYALFEQQRAEPTGETSTAQASRRREVKTKFYNRLPFGVGPIGYFLFRYIFQLGFLDGRPGAIYHFLQGCWYRFLVDAKRVELEDGMTGCTTAQQRIERLTQLTGHDLAAFELGGRTTA